MTNKNKQAIALCLVALMAISACAVVGVTTTVTTQAAPLKIRTVTTLGIYPTRPIACQWYTVYGTAKTTGGTTVGGSVQLFRSSGAGWKYWRTVPVYRGSFATRDVQRTCSRACYLAKYVGTSVYGASSTTRCVVVKYGNRLDISGGIVMPFGNSMFSEITGTLYYWSCTGRHPLANQYVHVYRSSPTGSVLAATVKTNRAGQWTMTEEAVSANYYARYTETGCMWGATSRTIQVGP